MSEQEQTDAQDMRDLLEAYRSVRRLGIWAVRLFSFVLVILSILLAIKKLKQ
jgi:hypothetical protein